MQKHEIKKTIKSMEEQAEGITERSAQKVIAKLFSHYETLFGEYELKCDENQSLKDELNKLKGEQGKPTIRKQSKKVDNEDNDDSSEKDRKKRGTPKNKKPRSKKKNKITDYETRHITIPDDDIPPGFYRNGTQTTYKQEIIFTVRNIRFVRDCIYNANTHEYNLAPLTNGYEGDYGPMLKAFVKVAHSDWEMSMPNITTMLKSANVNIVQSTVTRMINNNNAAFHEEKEAIVKAGITSTPYQHIDDTCARVAGKNHFVTILANPYYTAYFTVPRKNRLTVVDLLSIDGLLFSLNDESIDLMKAMGLSNCYHEQLLSYLSDGALTYDEMETILANIFSKKLIAKQRRIILEASAIVAYQNSRYAISQLIADNAPQFKGITEALGLCWIHEGRHYKKMRPVFEIHQQALANFREQFWDYYQLLHDFKKMPSDKFAQELSEKFDVLFSQTTGYEALDKQIALSKSRKEELLLVLKYPFIPLHNNCAELGARKEARGRDVHLHTRTANGTQTKDTYRTMGQTAKKLSVNFFNYVHDRIAGIYAMTSLAELIAQNAKKDVLLE